jgi:hypothetical protein
LVCAAVDAKVCGEPDRYATLLDEAEAIQLSMQAAVGRITKSPILRDTRRD